MFFYERQHISALGSETQLQAIYGLRNHVDEGGLISWRRSGGHLSCVPADCGRSIKRAGTARWRRITPTRLAAPSPPFRSAREDIRVREAPIRRPLGDSSYPKATFGFAQTATIGWTADPRQFPSGRLDRAENGHPRARDRTMIQYPCYETRPLTRWGGFDGLIATDSIDHAMTLSRTCDTLACRICGA